MLTHSTPPPFISNDSLKTLSRRLQASGFRSHDAEDAVQEAVLKAILHAELASLRQPEAWFYTVARNAARTSITRRREVNVERLPDQIYSSVDQFDEAEEQEHLLGAIHSAIDQLSDVKREILHRRYFMGEKFREVADSLGLAEGVVRGHLKRAHDLIRLHLLENCEIARNRYGM